MGLRGQRLLPSLLLPAIDIDAAAADQALLVLPSNLRKSKCKIWRSPPLLMIFPPPSLFGCWRTKSPLTVTPPLPEIPELVAFTRKFSTRAYSGWLLCGLVLNTISAPWLSMPCVMICAAAGLLGNKLLNSVVETQAYSSAPCVPEVADVWQW